MEPKNAALANSTPTVSPRNARKCLIAVLKNPGRLCDYRIQAIPLIILLKLFEQVETASPKLSVDNLYGGNEYGTGSVRYGQSGGCGSRLRRFFVKEFVSKDWPRRFIREHTDSVFFSNCDIRVSMASNACFEILGREAIVAPSFQMLEIEQPCTLKESHSTV